MWPWQAILSVTVMVSFTLLVLGTFPKHWSLRNTLIMRQLPAELAILTTTYNVLVVVTLCTQCTLVSLTHAGYDVPNFPNQLMVIVSFLAVPMFTSAGSLRTWVVIIKWDVALRKTKYVQYLQPWYQAKQILMVLAVCMTIAGICCGAFNRYNRVSDNRNGYAAHYYHEWWAFLTLTVVSLARSKKLSAGLKSVNDMYGMARNIRAAFALVVGWTVPYYLLNLISDVFEWGNFAGFDRNAIELAAVPLDYWMVVFHIVYYYRIILRGTLRAVAFNKQYSKQQQSENSVTRDRSTFQVSNLESTELLAVDMFGEDIIYEEYCDGDGGLHSTIDAAVTDQGVIVRAGTSLTPVNQRRTTFDTPNSRRSTYDQSRAGADRASVDSAVLLFRPSETVPLASYDGGRSPRSQTGSVRASPLLHNNRVAASTPMATRQLQAPLSPTNAAAKLSYTPLRSRSGAHSHTGSYDMTKSIRIKTKHWNCIRALRDPDMFSLLELHAKKSLNSEYTEFWAEMNAYKDKWYARRAEKQAGMHSVSQKSKGVAVDVDKTDRFADQPMDKREFCQYIYDKYIRNNAPFQVNISDAMRQKFERMAKMSNDDIAAEWIERTTKATEQQDDPDSRPPTRTKTRIVIDLFQAPSTAETPVKLPNTISRNATPGNYAAAANAAPAPTAATVATPNVRPPPPLNVAHSPQVDLQRLHGQQLFMVLLEIQREIYKLTNTNLWVTFKKSEEFTSRQLQSIDDAGEKQLLVD